MADLRKRTIYTAYSRILSMVIGIVSQLVLTPIILSYLGSALYGIYVIVNKANNFLSIVDIRPTAILRLRLAHDQSSNNMEEKCKYIGASYVISMLFIPIFVGGGCILAYFFPEWFHIKASHVPEARTAIIFLAIFLAANGFLGIPESILRGNNLEYKGYFVEPIRLLLVAGFTLLFLYYRLGLLSAVYAMFIGAAFAYISRSILRKRFLSEYSIKKPKIKHVRYFLKKGGWYLSSSFLMQTINNFDIILIGILMNPEAVTLFAITKSIIFRVVEAVENMVSSATSSIGEIVGSNDKERIISIRANLFNLVWPLALLFASYFCVFNESLITYWTGSSAFAGNNVNIIICISAIFLMLTCNEEIFILSSLNFKKKSLYLFISAITAVIVSIVLNKPLGLAGNALGILSGRSMLFVLYNRFNNVWIGGKLPINALFLCKSSGLMILVFAFNYCLKDLITISFFYFILGSIAFFTMIGMYSYIGLFTDKERELIKKFLLKTIRS